MSKKRQKIYLDIARAPKAEIDAWKRGVLIESTAGEPIQEIFRRACTFRYRLGIDFLRAARREMIRENPRYRSVIGRSYYAMYHCIRSVVYLVHGGDDHEAHSNVPKRIPGDFPDRADWQNKLRESRLDRNKADYDPFPLSDQSYKKGAERTLGYALDFSKVIKRYLINKGVDL